MIIILMLTISVMFFDSFLVEATDFAMLTNDNEKIMESSFWLKIFSI